jgi:hypothetical protein
MDHNQERRRGHFNRGRRGPERRGNERRTPPPQAQEQSGRDHVDVEQIMRDIRARISQRHGIDLSNQQIQELAARRLEAILDPRTIKPGLLDELRRSAGAPPPQPEPADAAELSYSFEDTTLYESSRGLLRGIRRLLNPILKLFFNPNPLIRALNLQARWNGETSRRLAERDRRQTEWNALHYELLHRMVTEVSKVSLELQSLASQIESLSAKVDFNDRRVRSMEALPQQSQARPAPRMPPEPVNVPAVATPGGEAPVTEAPAEGQPSESTRRRRRRRRGRRGSGAPSEGTPGSPGQPSASDSEFEGGAEAGDESGSDEGTDEQPVPSFQPPIATTPMVATAPEAVSTPLSTDVPQSVFETHTPAPEEPAPPPEPREPSE